jgi:hypothetical protein
MKEYPHFQSLLSHWLIQSSRGTEEGPGASTLKLALNILSAPLFHEHYHKRRSLPYSLLFDHALATQMLFYNNQEMMPGCKKLQNKKY